MNNDRFMPMVNALQSAGYNGPMPGTPAFHDARAAGGTPIRDWRQSLPAGSHPFGGLMTGSNPLGGGRPPMFSGNAAGEMPHPGMGYGGGMGGNISPPGMPTPPSPMGGYNTGIVPPHMGGSPVPMPPVQGGPGPVPGGGYMPHMPPRPIFPPRGGILPQDPGMPSPQLPPTG